MSLPHRFGAVFRIHGWKLVFCGIILIIAGLRFAITDRNSTPLPVGDDWSHLPWLRTFATDQPDYGYPFRYHNEHYYAAAPLFTLAAWKLNGLWDVRLETLIYSVVYICYAGMLMWFFLKVTGNRGRLALCLLALVFLALPVSGVRGAWGYLSGFPLSMGTGLAGLYFAVYAGRRWSHVVAALICAVISTAALAGCGSLMALAVAAVLAVRAMRQREWPATALVLIGGLVLLTALAIFTKPARVGVPPVITPGIILSAVTRSLAWPSVFAPPAVVFNILPGLLLLIAWWRDPRMRTPAVEAILAVHAFLILQAAGVAVFRGENNNMAMPSNRYYDILLITPFAAVAACVVLLQVYPLRLAPRLATFLLALALAGGAGIHFLYRMWPYMARENGEGVEPSKVEWIRGLLRDGWQDQDRGGAGENNETYVGMGEHTPLVRDWVERKGEDPILPATMITGHPLKAESAGPFTEGGFQKSYTARPATRYWGSCGASHGGETGTFLSAPFTVHGSYLIFDLLLQNKARFSFYKLQGCELNVVDAATGEKIPVLPRLLHSLPSLLRDREAVAVPVKPGGNYRVEASDMTAEGWFAFSEPADAGRLAPVLLAVTSSGKLLALTGIMLAAVGWIGLRMNAGGALQS